MSAACGRFRGLVHARLDGELRPEGAAELDRHLAACASCRSFAAELDELREGLLALPEHPLPPAVARAVLDRTVRTPVRDRRGLAEAWFAWAAAAAAAAILLGVLWSRQGPSPASAGAGADLAKAKSEARYVLALTARVLRESEIKARDRVVVGEVAPALRRVPVRWSDLSSMRKL